jgi:hypothetical protein
MIKVLWERYIYDGEKLFSAMVRYNEGVARRLAAAALSLFWETCRLFALFEIKFVRSDYSL